MNRIDNIPELNANNIFVYDDFIDPKTCNDLLFAINDNFWEPSRIIVTGQDSIHHAYDKQFRTSKTVYDYLFPFEFQQKILQFQPKIARIANIDEDKLEGWQITKYGFEEKFEFHLDGGFFKDDPAGERDKTILLYLMSPQKGGETYFRALNLYIRPVQGRLVVWDNLLPNGNCNHAMLHAGLSVKKGVKIILTTWSRQFPIIKTQQYEKARKSH